MALADALRATLEVVQALDEFEVPYLLGGSLASSLHGIPRSTQDADLVADLAPRHVAPLVARLQPAFYIDDERAREAVERRSSFNMIHLATMTKVDVFVLKPDPLSRREMERRQLVSLPSEPHTSLWVASAEDIILQKLAWFALGGGVSERQWQDVLGVLKVRGGELDFDQMRRDAEEAGLSELVRKVLDDAEVRR